MWRSRGSGETVGSQKALGKKRREKTGTVSKSKKTKWSPKKPCRKNFNDEGGVLPSEKKVEEIEAGNREELRVGFGECWEDRVLEAGRDESESVDGSLWVQGILKGGGARMIRTGEGEISVGMKHRH